jgi:hypothetical protein
MAYAMQEIVVYGLNETRGGQKAMAQHDHFQLMCGFQIFLLLQMILMYSFKPGFCKSMISNDELYRGVNISNASLRRLLFNIL